MDDIICEEPLIHIYFNTRKGCLPNGNEYSNHQVLYVVTILVPDIQVPIPEYTRSFISENLFHTRKTFQLHLAMIRVQNRISEPEPEFSKSILVPVKRKRNSGSIPVSIRIIRFQLYQNDMIPPPPG